MLSSYRDGIVEIDKGNLIKHLPKNVRWIMKDSYHYLSLMVNIQAGTYGWETAKHYDTGIEVRSARVTL